MRRLIEGLKSAGIEPRDIQTTSFNVEPRYEQTRDGRSPFIIGYRVHKEVRITVRDIGSLGQLLDRAVTLGANQPLVLAGALDLDASRKAARFVRFCDCFDIPIPTFVDVQVFSRARRRSTATWSSTEPSCCSPSRKRRCPK